MTTELNAPLTIEELTPSTQVTGKVTHISLYGAMLDIGLPQEALLHISQMGDAPLTTFEQAHANAQPVTAYVLKVDSKNGHIALTMVKPPAVTWEQIRVGQVYDGEVVRIEKFGAFVDIGAERPGMVHVSELADGYVGAPEDVVTVGQAVEARVIKLNRKKRQIDLSMRTPAEEVQTAMQPEEELPTAMAIALRRAMNNEEETATDERPTNKKKREDRELDDIIARTLRNQQN